ncbi:unnamed protein product [Ascophyllum nodosum]
MKSGKAEPAMTPLQAKNRAGLMALLSSLSYSFCSVSMVMSNKALAFNFHVKMTFLLVVMQCFVATVIVEVARRMGFATFEPFNMATARRWLPVTVCFSTMLFTSFKALEIMNVPMVTVFKNLTNIVIVTGDWWLFQQSATVLVILSMAVMVFGAIVASYHDLNFNAWGYFWMLANCCATAGYVLYMKYATKTIKLPRFGMVFYNNLLTTCILAPLAYLYGDFHVLLTSPQLHTLSYMTINLFSGVVGVLLNFASLWCVGATSATTYAVVGSVNVIPTAILGWCLFETEISVQMGQFMFVSMTGGFMYSFAKLEEKRRRDRQSQLIAVSSPRQGKMDAPLISENGGPLLDLEQNNADQTADHKA